MIRNKHAFTNMKVTFFFTYWYKFNWKYVRFSVKSKQNIPNFAKFRFFAAISRCSFCRELFQ